MAQLCQRSASADTDSTEFLLPLRHRLGDVPFFFPIGSAVFQLGTRLDHMYRRRQQLCEDIVAFYQKREDPPAPEKLPPPEYPPETPPDELAASRDSATALTPAEYPWW